LPLTVCPTVDATWVSRILASGCGGGGAAPAGSAASVWPHFWQNFAPSSFVLPQFEQNMALASLNETIVSCLRFEDPRFPATPA
jgi:hypothetical protein